MNRTMKKMTSWIEEAEGGQTYGGMIRVREIYQGTRRGGGANIWWNDACKRDMSGNKKKREAKHMVERCV